MKELFINGRVWQEDHSFAENCPILVENGRILAVGKGSDSAAADRVTDCRGLMVLPGLLDVHTHGRAGGDFSTASAEKMRQMRTDYLRHGVTSLFPTLASGTAEKWHTAIRNIQACGFDGIHLEGRYLNPVKRGAHPERLLVPLSAADLEEYLCEIRIPCHVTAAYELDTDGSFAAKALEHGATLGLGHTNATTAEAELAVSRGVTSFTHLYNAMPPLHHRAGGAVSVALNGGYYGELIADGMHVCPEMIRLAYRCLGKDRFVLITDSMEATGCPDGQYAIAGQPVQVVGGRALTLDGALAGSTLNLWDGVQNLMRFAGVPLEDAIACAALNPARMVGVSEAVGSIAPGKRADLLLTEDGAHLKTVISAGVPVI